MELQASGEMVEDSHDRFNIFIASEVIIGKVTRMIG